MPGPHCYSHCTIGLVHYDELVQCVLCTVVDRQEWPVVVDGNVGGCYGEHCVLSRSEEQSKVSMKATTKGGVYQTCIGFKLIGHGVKRFAIGFTMYDIQIRVLEQGFPVVGDSCLAAHGEGKRRKNH